MTRDTNRLISLYTILNLNNLLNMKIRNVCLPIVKDSLSEIYLLLLSQTMRKTLNNYHHSMVLHSGKIP